MDQTSDKLNVNSVKPIDQFDFDGFCLPRMLQHQAIERPNEKAVRFEHHCLTYQELVESSSYVAMYLRRQGVTSDERVGIFVEPSLDLMIGVWGTLFAGGAYLPLSPEYPENRLCYMIEHAQIKIVFTQEKLRKKLAELAPPSMQIVTLEKVLAFMTSDKALKPFKLQANIDPDHLAYIIYTSGSTGKPKGVMISHRSIVNQMQWMKTACGLDTTKVVLQKTLMSFDAAQWEILAPACGSTVVMGYPEIYRDIEGLVDTIIQEQVTTLQCVPTLLQALLDADEISECKSLTQIFSGGEALSRQLAKECLEKLPKCDLVNLYGPTECTINASAFFVHRKKIKDDLNMIPIGTPVSNTQFYILDRNHNLMPNGEIGELYIGGVQLARGYLNQPELTAERFIIPDWSNGRLYRTGDLACRNADGTFQFKSRSDHQVKLRGFRIELDEVRLAIEKHHWVKHAVVLTTKDTRTNFQQLISYIELNSKEAALMDQNNHGAHHQSKASRLQVRAQISNMGCRDSQSIKGKPFIDLPGKTASKKMRELIFARKSYRFYEGGSVAKEDLEQLLSPPLTHIKLSRNPDTLTLNEFSEIFRHFGQFISQQRLLPKYGYASPGALYATQMYIEVGGTAYLDPGVYYYHPVYHQLIKINEKTDANEGCVKINFIGKTQAIEPVYKENIHEVLEIETGHMLGLFDNVLPNYGLCINRTKYTPDVIKRLECADNDCYMGTFEWAPYTLKQTDTSLDIYVQSHPNKIINMPDGQYRYNNGRLEWFSGQIIEKKHVIAINQQVYERASFGITVVNQNNDQFSYIELGRKLQQLQMNTLHLGFMSSGYSSKSGNDLPAAKRITQILINCNMKSGPSYFFVGGRVSDEQWRSENMREDLVHMKGPAEMIKEDLTAMLPEYMVPKGVIVMNKLPLTANDKIDINALKALEQKNALLTQRPFIPPRTLTEARIGCIWLKALNLETISTKDDFFECGGNSLIALTIVHHINREFNKTLPLQIIFEAPTIEKLGSIIDGENACGASRMIPLHMECDSNQPPIYCWPGLGGYPMNLRLLATQLDLERTICGIQAHGINESEIPFTTIKEMAAKDIKEIKRIQPSGPFALWGYSFGARVAFEAAYQLEQAGDKVEHLFLIAPGAPKIRDVDASVYSNEPTFDNRAFVTILFLVFAGNMTDPALNECLDVSKDESSFVSFINSKYQHLQSDMIKRIVQIVRQTYEFKYTFVELQERRLNTPITIFKAFGDDYSFIENTTCYFTQTPTIIDLQADHYTMLKNPELSELIDSIRGRLNIKVKNLQKKSSQSLLISNNLRE